jgi:hypothetical protein
MPAPRKPSHALPAPEPARSYFVMNRVGRFTPAHHTSNQCKAPGYPEYTYMLRMVFPGDMKLDANGFIIDHAQVNDMVVKLAATGSCEDMARVILTALDQFMTAKRIPLVACKCIIRPTDPDAPAWMERIHVAPGSHVEALRLLQ